MNCALLGKAPFPVTLDVSIVSMGVKYGRKTYLTQVYKALSCRCFFYFKVDMGITKGELEVFYYFMLEWIIQGI